MSELAVLRTVALKGRVHPEQLAGSTGLDLSTVERLSGALADAGHLVTTPQGLLRTTKEGRGHLQEMLEQERAGIAVDAVRACYGDFCDINARAKEIFTGWQVTPDGQPNDHADASYDADVLHRLDGIHAEILPLLDRVAPLVGRAARYRERLAAARGRYAAGEHDWVTKPVIDSYHTVWFELHEDLISWSGLTRVQEAAAGRAT